MRPLMDSRRSQWVAIIGMGFLKHEPTEGSPVHIPVCQASYRLYPILPSEVYGGDYFINVWHLTTFASHQPYRIIIS